MDGHPRQNPAYRPATEKAPATGLFLWGDALVFPDVFISGTTGSERGRQRAGTRGIRPERRTRGESMRTLALLAAAAAALASASTASATPDAHGQLLQV